MSADITGTGIGQKELHTFLANVVTMCNELKTNLNAVNAKLDADAGITDTNYAALHDAATTDLTLSGL